MTAIRAVDTGSRYIAGRGQITTVEAWGHSMAAGFGVQPAEAYPALVAARLGATLVNNAVSGMSAVDTEWERIFDVDTRAAQYGSIADLAIVHYGFNDLALVDATTAQGRRIIVSALRTIIARLRANTVREIGHASITYSTASGGWGDLGGAQWSGSDVKYTFVVGATVTIELEPEFPGGTIGLIGYYADDRGNDWSVTVDGGPATVMSMGANTGGPALDVADVLRTRPLAPGAHTIVATVTGFTAAAHFDGYHIEPLAPPVVLAPQVWDYSGLTEAERINLNADLVALLAEFDQPTGAFAVPIMDNNPGLTTDAVHPSVLGHRQIAAAALWSLDQQPTIATAAI